jgi:predicted DNA-binding protein
MSESTMVLTLSQESRERLERLSVQLGRTVDECTQLALDEFIDRWEDYLRTVAELQDGPVERPVLRVVND